MTDYPELNDLLISFGMKYASWVQMVDAGDDGADHYKETILDEAKAQLRALMIRERVDELEHVDRHTTYYPDGSPPIEAQTRIGQLKAQLSASSSPCGRNYDDGGAHTVQIIDDVLYCPACKQPIAAHKKRSASVSKEKP